MCISLDLEEVGSRVPRGVQSCNDAVPAKVQAIVTVSAQRLHMYCARHQSGRQGFRLKAACLLVGGPVPAGCGG